MVSAWKLQEQMLGLSHPVHLFPLIHVILSQSHFPVAHWDQSLHGSPATFKGVEGFFLCLPVIWMRSIAALSTICDHCNVVTDDSELLGHMKQIKMGYLVSILSVRKTETSNSAVGML